MNSINLQQQKKTEEEKLPKLFSANSSAKIKKMFGVLHVTSLHLKLHIINKANEKLQFSVFGFCKIFECQKIQGKLNWKILWDGATTATT